MFVCRDCNGSPLVVVVAALLSPPASHGPYPRDPTTAGECRRQPLGVLPRVVNALHPELGTHDAVDDHVGGRVEDQQHVTDAGGEQDEHGVLLAPCSVAQQRLVNRDSLHNVQDDPRQMADQEDQDDAHEDDGQMVVAPLQARTPGPRATWRGTSSSTCGPGGAAGSKDQRLQGPNGDTPFLSLGAEAGVACSRS